MMMNDSVISRTLKIIPNSSIHEKPLPSPRLLLRHRRHSYTYIHSLSHSYLLFSGGVIPIRFEITLEEDVAVTE
jgi:hypothetical protein